MFLAYQASLPCRVKTRLSFAIGLWFPWSFTRPQKTTWVIFTNRERRLIDCALILNIRSFVILMQEIFNGVLMWQSAGIITSAVHQRLYCRAGVFRLHVSEEIRVPSNSEFNSIVFVHCCIQNAAQALEL